jgi:hypothetical protein
MRMAGAQQATGTAGPTPSFISGNWGPEPGTFSPAGHAAREQAWFKVSRKGLAC